MDREQVAGDVARGAVLMDSYDDLWYERINRSILDMCDAFECVLGQYFGHYATGLSKLFDFTDGLFYSPNYGFTITMAADHDDRDWEFLRQCWLNEIAIRIERGNRDWYCENCSA